MDNQLWLIVTVFAFVAGSWFMGPDYSEQARCEKRAAEIRIAAPNATVVCGPRGMP